MLSRMCGNKINKWTNKPNTTLPSVVNAAFKTIKIRSRERLTREIERASVHTMLCFVLFQLLVLFGSVLFWFAEEASTWIYLACGINTYLVLIPSMRAQRERERDKESECTEWQMRRRVAGTTGTPKLWRRPKTHMSQMVGWAWAIDSTRWMYGQWLMLRHFDDNVATRSNVKKYGHHFISTTSKNIRFFSILRSIS